MQLSEFLRPERVVTGLASMSADELLEQLLRPLVEEGCLGMTGPVLETLRGREEVLSTGIGNGIAVPHAITPEVRELAIVVGIVPEGVDFGAMDERPVFAFFLLLSPPDGEARSAHLKLLARIAQLAKDPGFARRLRSCADAASVIDVIRDTERTHP